MTGIDERCPVSELRVGECAHCRLTFERVEMFSDPEERYDGEYGPTFDAAYAGRCAECGDRFDPGDSIRRGPDGYACSGCAP